MNHNNIEVEIKSLLLNEDVLTSDLNDIALFKGELRQVDYYYNPPQRDFVSNPDIINEWLRLRISDGKCVLTYKDWLPHKSKTKNHCMEFETAVSSFEGIKQISDVLNFRLLVVVAKRRRVWLLDDIEISIDLVEYLGTFIEIECIGSSTNIETIRGLLLSALNRIGAEIGELYTKGYTHHILERQGYFKKIVK
jgi:predicted adenylyl cyclase CyaB